MMKTKRLWKRLAAISLAVTLAIPSGLLISYYADAAEENLVKNSGFDTVGTWKDQNDTEIQAQTIVDDVIIHEIVENGGFENGNYQSGVNGWQSRSGAALSVIDASDDAANKVLQVEAAAGGAQANFYFGEAGILEEGKTYTVSFDVRQTAGSGGITLYSALVINGWDSHGWNPVSDGWTKMEYEITPAQSTAWAQIGFQVDAACTLEVDNFSITYEGGSQTAKTYSEGIGNCNGEESGNVLVMKENRIAAQNIAVKSGIEAAAHAPAEGQEIKAKLPGNVLRIEVSEGDTIQEGDVLLIVEAMKMETEITSPVSGVVRSLEVEVGNQVQSGQVLAVVG